MKKTNWHFRKNRKRKMGSKKISGHPALVVGETDDGSSYYNIDLTKNKKRGYHKNVSIHNPQNWEEESFLRDDISLDPKEYLNIVLKDYKLCPEDINKIWDIKKRIPTRR